MFNFFKKKKDFDAGKFAQDMMRRNSQLNIRDKMAILVESIINNKGYESFSEGIIFLNSDINFGWINPKTKELLIFKSDRPGDVVCGIEVINIINDDEFLYDEELSLIGTSEQPSEVIIDYATKMFSNKVCEFFAENSEGFLKLPRL